MLKNFPTQYFNSCTVLYVINCISLFFITSVTSFAQAPNPALIGYFHNWQDANAPYIQLDQIDSRYNIIDIAFATPVQGTDYKMAFTPDQVSVPVFLSQIQNLQAQGKKVLISIGGANATVSLDNIMERDSFISSMNSIINTYGLDGLDIDLEGSSVTTSGGTISSPTDQKLIHLIDAIKQIMLDYYTTNNRRLILTMAPETAFVQGGQSAYGGIWGAYLPLINALRDSIEILHVQLYNSGSMYGLDGNIYTQGTADFIVAQCEAVVQGFNTSGGFFAGLPASKIAVGLPACSSAAGGGFIDTIQVKAAINYLRGNGPQVGSYTLIQSGAYPNLRGMMTWSINWDAVTSCGTSYEYANNFEQIFGPTTSLENEITTARENYLYPNPSTGIFTFNSAKNNFKGEINVFNILGSLVFTKSFASNNFVLDLEKMPAGVYIANIFDGEKYYFQKLIIE